MSGAWRTACEVVGVLILLGAFALWERHQGAVKCVAANVAAVAAQVTQNAATLVVQNAELTKELSAHAIAVSMPALPSTPLRCVRVSAAPRPVSKTTAPQPRSNDTAALSAGAGAGAQSFDPSLAVKQVGINADAQVIELQTYITTVCLAH